MLEYDSIADWYPTERSRTFGVAEALAIAAILPAQSCILDIGCGNGVPITEALVNAGHRVREDYAIEFHLRGRRPDVDTIPQPACVAEMI